MSMSQLGQELTWRQSALPPIADIRRMDSDVLLRADSVEKGFSCAR